MRSLTILLAVCAAGIAQDLPKAFQDPPLIRDGRYALWHNPGQVESLDFRYGIGGQALAPQPPFTFLDEDVTGTTPKVSVKDARDHHYVIKFGDEASPDTFGSRMAWAMGYYAEPNYFVPSGTIQGIKNLQRARKVVDSSGHFQNGRFQLRAKEPKFLRTVDWLWDQNPFVGTPELNGLKILMMLLSNWDDKDGRDAEKRGSNAAILQLDSLFLFFIDDWGGAMGHWGKYFTRSKWKANDFSRQSADFVSVEGGQLHWGYRGQHSELMTDGVTATDIAWLMQYLGRVTDAQLRDGLLASGATPEQERVYLEALRQRINQLQQPRTIVSSR